MSEIVVVSVLAMLFSLANLLLLVFLVKRHEEGCYTVISYDGYPVKMTRVSKENSGLEPGIYFPEEEDEAKAINDNIARSTYERTNPFRGWGIHSEVEDEV